jgi:hypothetical protein
MKLFAKEDLKEGDVITLIWKYLVRRSKINDTKIIGFVKHDYKKGERIEYISQEEIMEMEKI